MNLVFFFSGVFLLVVGVSSVSVEHEENGSIEKAPGTNVKRWHTCTKRCYHQSQCTQDYFCYYYYRCCFHYSKKRCSHHSHCPQSWYCDFRYNNWGLCRKGPRRCSSHYHCYPDLCVNGYCRKRQCYYHSQCKQGYGCYSGICKPIPGYCTSQSSCKPSQCCSKIYPTNQGGLCRNLKKPGEYCPVKPDGYHCGCVKNFTCVKLYSNSYWGICKKACSTDRDCGTSHCCSGGYCKEHKKANEWCPIKGPDEHNCDCIDGYQCQQYNGHHYYGICVIKPTEEPGSGGGEFEA